MRHGKLSQPIAEGQLELRKRIEAHPIYRPHPLKRREAAVALLAGQTDAGTVTAQLKIGPSSRRSSCGAGGSPGCAG